MGLNKNLLPNIIVSLSFILLSTTHGSPSHSTIDFIFKRALKANEQAFKSPNPKVLDFCRGTENPILCTETTAPYFQADSFDPIKALQTEVEATLNQTVKVAGIISETINDTNTDERARQALHICKSQYKSIVSTIKEAVELLDQQNVVDAYYKFSSVISDQSSCEDAFVESPGVTIPFDDESLIVYQLGSNCLAIMDGIVNSRSNHFLF